MIAPKGSYTNGPIERRVDRVVLHTTESSDRNGEVRKYLSRIDTSISVHYLIGVDGEIYSFVSERDVAHHCGNWEYNARSIGIELEGISGNAKSTFKWQTPRQMHMLRELLSEISMRHGFPVDRLHVIGHNEIPYKQESGTIWGGKSNHTDPGPLFSWAAALDFSGSLPRKHAVRLTSTVACTTLPAADAPIIKHLQANSVFAVLSKHEGYLRISVPAIITNRNDGSVGQFHSEGWVSESSAVSVNDYGICVVSDSSNLPVEIYMRPGLGFIATCFSLQRLVLTGRVSDDGLWSEIYIVDTTGWVLSKKLKSI